MHKYKFKDGLKCMEKKFNANSHKNIPYGNFRRFNVLKTYLNTNLYV